MRTSAGKKLRDLLSRGMVVAPGAFNAMTGRLVEQAGFQAVYMTGSGTSASYGYPDFGLLTMSEMVDNAAAIARSTTIPLIADADTGYGNELNVTRTVREYEQRGVAALHLEDQVSPKRCGHLEGKEVVSREEFMAKIAAAVAAREDPDFVIIARTDARGVIGLEEAIRRMNDALSVGADMAFVEAPQTMEEVISIPRRVKGPCLFNLAPGTKSPVIDLRETAKLGYTLCIVPGILSKATVEACDDALEVLRTTHLPPTPRTSVAEGFRRFGADEWNALRRKFAPKPADGPKSDKSER